MALNFPNSPTIGDEFTGGGFTWTWTGSAWEKVAVATASSNGFTLFVGASGNTTYTFDEAQPAGDYVITSKLNDTTYDVYFVTSEDAPAGYTNGVAIEATAAFNRVVVYGATSNDVLTFEAKPSATPAASGNVADGAAPFLTSATPATLAAIDSTTTVTGGNFATDVQIVFTGQDAVNRPAKNIVRTSSTQLIVTRPDSFPVAQEPYTMTATNAGITNPSTNVNRLSNYFDAGGAVTWVTASQLPNYTNGVSYTTTLQATDADGGAVTYSIQSGSLPTGLTLNGTTGVISGTPADSGNKTVTITATDPGGNSLNRTFNLTDSIPINYLVIAGGGGGGRSSGAGGGAGGYRTSFGTSGGNSSAESIIQTVSNTSFTVTVGAGGAGMTSGAVTPNGSNSVFSTITSIGGGGGGGHNENGNQAYVVGRSGGSGGGSWSSFQPGGAGTANQGFKGGDGTPGPGYGETTGGGGGAGAVGGNGVGNTSNGDGGVGLSSSITGSAIFRAAGGGGGAGSWNNLPNGVGGNGGGGNGGRSTSINGANAVANTGSGGGGGSYSGNFVTLGTAGNGASGVVILRYPSGFSISGGAGLSFSTSTVGTDKVTTFTSGTGTITIG